MRHAYYLVCETVINIEPILEQSFLFIKVR